MIRSSIQIYKKEPFFVKDLISLKHIDYRLFIIFPLDLRLLSKRRTSENKGSNILFGIIN